MKINRSTIFTEFMWAVYFLVLSYFLVGFYSTFKLTDQTVLPYYSLMHSMEVIQYPKWIVVMFVWSLFLVAQALIFIGSLISKKGVKATLYLVSSAFILVPIFMCLHLTYLKRQYEKSRPATEISLNYDLKK